MRLGNYWKKSAKVVMVYPFSDAFKSGWNIFLKSFSSLIQLMGLGTVVPMWHPISMDTQVHIVPLVRTM